MEVGGKYKYTTKFTILGGGGEHRYSETTGVNYLIPFTIFVLFTRRN